MLAKFAAGLTLYGIGLTMALRGIYLISPAAALAAGGTLVFLAGVKVLNQVGKDIAEGK